jgi:hypothetical protein
MVCLVRDIKDHVAASRLHDDPALGVANQLNQRASGFEQLWEVYWHTAGQQGWKRRCWCCTSAALLHEIVDLFGAHSTCFLLERLRSSS